MRHWTLPPSGRREPIFPSPRSLRAERGERFPAHAPKAHAPKAHAHVFSPLDGAAVVAESRCTLAQRTLKHICTALLGYAAITAGKRQMYDVERMVLFLNERIYLIKISRLLVATLAAAKQSISARCRNSLKFFYASRVRRCIEK